MNKEERKQGNLETEWKEAQICAEILKNKCGKIVTCKNGKKYVEIGRRSK